MKKYMIEREIPKAGKFQRLESFVTEEKTFCLYLAKD